MRTGLSARRLGDGLEDLRRRWPRPRPSRRPRRRRPRRNQPDVGALLGLRRPRRRRRPSGLELRLGRRRAPRARGRRRDAVERARIFMQHTPSGTLSPGNPGYGTPGNSAKIPPRNFPHRASHRRARGPRAANSAKRRPDTGSPPRFSGCHWTATSQCAPVSSTASGRPSGASADTARPGREAARSPGGGGC